MKTKINFFLTIMLVASVSMSFISCGGDDSNEKSGGNSDNSMVQNLMSHKWYCTSTDYDAYSYGGATYTQTWTVYFINEHQGVMHWTAVDRDSSLGTSRNEDDFEFEYYINGNTISLYGESNFTFTYYGNYLMEGDDVFEAKVLTSSDYSFISNYGSDTSSSNGNGPIDTDFYVLGDNELLFGASYIDSFDRGNAWWQYLYTIQFGFGVGADAWTKGMSTMKATIWVDNGSINSEKSKIGNKIELSLDINTNTKSDFYDWLYVYSADNKITLHYTIEYYNRFDGNYYTALNDHTVTLYVTN